MIGAPHGGEQVSEKQGVVRGLVDWNKWPLLLPLSTMELLRILNLPTLAFQFAKQICSSRYEDAMQFTLEPSP